MPYKDRDDYRNYMRRYMRQQRNQVRTLKTEIARDMQKLEKLRREFPSVYELLYGKKGRKTKWALSND